VINIVENNAFKKTAVFFCQFEQKFLVSNFWISIQQKNLRTGR